MQITTEQVKQLRDETGISVMQCRKALEEALGDMEKARLILKKKSTDMAAKKADREAHDGMIVIKQTDTTAIVTILNCETDFVAKNDDFIALANTVAEKAQAESIEAALAATPEMINAVIQKIGENILLQSIEKIEAPVVGTYIHNPKLAVVVGLSAGTPTLARDIAMHAAAMKPEFVRIEDIDEETRAKFKALFEEEVAQIDKPADIKAKMLEGKVNTYFKERALLEQPFVKNPDKTVGALLKENNADIVVYKMFVI